MRDVRSNYAVSSMSKQTKPQTLGDKQVYHPFAHMSASTGSIEDELSLVELWNMLWSRKRLITVMTLIAMVAAIIYSLVAPPVYRVETLVKLQGDYGSEATATLQSMAFMEDFIRQESLLPWIFREKWDAQNEVWTVKEDDIPSLRQGAIVIKEHMIVEKQEQLTVIGLRSTDPLTAVDVINKIIQRLNDIVAESALEKAEKRIQHYQEQLFSFDSLFANRIAPEALSRTDEFLPENNRQNVTAVINYLQAQLMNSGSISERKNLIDNIQSSENVIMRVANERDEFALKVFDPASVPDKDEKIWPKRKLIVLAGFIGGLFGSVMLAVVLGLMRRSNYKQV